MSVTSGFFNSINGDRTYNAEQMSSIFDGIINDGVFANIGTAFSVQATTGSTVNIGTGRCWFDSTWLLNDATLPIELDDAEVLLDRIDAIVIEINHSESIRAGSIKVVNGTPSSTPANPTMTHTDYINQYPIAYIMRSANSDAITQANITYVVGSNACPFVTGILSVVSIQNIVAQWENEFDTWLDGLSAMLDDNTAANLANQILELKEQFDTLAKEKKIYSELEDSTGEDTIDDSTGAPILGTTAMYSDDGTSESIPGTVTGGDPYKVGDILTTARTDLGAKWLLCNGDVLDRDLYPELANLLPYAIDITGNWTKDINIGSGDDYATVHNIKYLNGYYVRSVTTQNGSGTSKNVNLYIEYALSLSGPWTKVDIITKTGDSAANGYLNSTLDYLNGYYVVSGWYRDSVVDNFNDQGMYAYTSSLDGPWTVVRPGKENLSSIGSIVYENGYYAFAYSYETNRTGSGSSETVTYDLILCYATDLGGSWSTKVIDTLSCTGFGFAITHHIGDFKFVNDRFIATFNFSNSPMTADNPSVDVYVYFTDSLLGSWTKKKLYTSWGNMTTDLLTSILYVDGNYVLAGGKTDTSTSKQKRVVVISSDLNGTWETKTIYDTPGENGTINQLIYNDGLYAALTKLDDAVTILASETLDGQWVAKKIFEKGQDDINYVSPESIDCYDGLYMVSGRIRTSTDNLYHGAMAYLNPGEINLPSISLSDKTYTYIRAKE